MGLKPATFRFPTAVTPDTCFQQDTKDSADLNSARHGQLQEKGKKAPTTESNIFLSKVFFDKRWQIKNVDIIGSWPKIYVTEKNTPNKPIA